MLSAHTSAIIYPKLHPYLFIYYRSFHNTFSPSNEQYRSDYEALGLPFTADAASARDAFIKLAKIYHPDSGNKLADETKFKIVESSYRRLLQKFSDERHNNNKCEGEYGLYYEQKKKPEENEQEESGKGYYTIKHTAPQHRNYLSYEGLGMGTPAQREKQYTKYKAMRATENVIDFKVSQFQKDYPESSMVSKEKAAAKRFKTRYGIERVVEDMIQESMAKGDFDNLPNAGKPLEYQNHNPYVDAVTHKLNQVLIENGYAPEWVLLEKEIRDDKSNIRSAMVKQRECLGALPLSSTDKMKWDQHLLSLGEEIATLNKKIDKYNLLVPVLSKQMVHYPIVRIANKVLNYES